MNPLFNGKDQSIKVTTLYNIYFQRIEGVMFDTADFRAIFLSNPNSPQSTQSSPPRSQRARIWKEWSDHWMDTEESNGIDTAKPMIKHDKLMCRPRTQIRSVVSGFMRGINPTFENELVNICADYIFDIGNLVRSEDDIDDIDLDNWIAVLRGPKETPYEGGIFYVKISFSHNYPFWPPEIQFITKVYSCSITDRGYLCLDNKWDQAKEWSPAVSLLQLLLIVKSLLADSNPDDSVAPERAELFAASEEAYEQNAREWTKTYAM